ncbi:MAG TPA: ATP-binding protein, partial [Candidatus Sulfotelmatobacter sp.]|nr:ATP-binding protein [Candidatus Sulfotelmatobacter sp.]
PLTTLRTRFDELGLKAANLLLDEIGATAVARRAHRVPVALIRRRSCGCDMSENVALASVAEPLASRSNSALAAQLVRTAQFPVAPEPGRAPEEIWPGIQTLIGGMDSARAGAPEPARAALIQAWREAVHLIPDLEVLRAMSVLLARAAAERLATAPPDPDRAQRVAAFLERSELNLWHARLGYEREQMAHLEELTQNSPTLAMTLLSGQTGQAQELAWLRLTPVRWGCLALYPDATRTPKTILRVAGTYRRSGPPLPSPGTEFVAGAFPPADWFPEPGADVNADVLMLLTVASASRDWGVLALCGPFEKTYGTYGTYTAQRPNNIAMWGALLAAALDREALEARLTELADEDRKRAEEALRRSEATLAEAQRLSHMGSWVWSRSSNAISWSAEMLRLFGFDPQQGQPSREAIEQRIDPDDRERVHAIHETAVREKTDLEHDYRILLPDGTVKHVHATCHPVPNAAGDVVELLGTVRDVTERKQAEGALREAHAALAHVTRVTTLGAVTASIAHEVKQPLAAIVNNANASLRLLASGGHGVDGVRDILADIVNDAERANDIIERVRALAKRSAPERVEVRPIDLVNDVLALAAAESAARRMVPRTDVPVDLPVVAGDRVQLQQVLLNLVVNAMDAMAGVDEAERRLEIRGRLEPWDGVWGVTFSVADRGIGLQPEETDQLFDAFYTTKPHGMGLGLAISRSIIDAHGGRLWAESNRGEGATFSFHLPAAHRSASA